MGQTRSGQTDALQNRDREGADVVLRNRDRLPR
jgi:hypothetical protein